MEAVLIKFCKPDGDVSFVGAEIVYVWGFWCEILLKINSRLSLWCSCHEGRLISCCSCRRDIVRQHKRLRARAVDVEGTGT